MSIGDHVVWLVWCPECRDVHHISHLDTDDHGQHDDTERAWQHILDKLIAWGRAA